LSGLMEFDQNSTMVISKQLRADYSALIDQAGSSHEQYFTQIREEVLKVTLARCREKGMIGTVPIFKHIVDKRPDKLISAEVFRRAIIARFALDLPSTIKEMNLPPIILAEYPAMLKRLLRNLTEIPDDDWDPYARDICLALGLLLPAGPQDINWNAGRSPRMFVTSAIKERRPFLIWRYLFGRYWHNWLESHTDSRHLAQFNENGWRCAYRCIADLMRVWPNVPAYVASAWFYDPVVREISPRLAYLQDVPLGNGAYVIRNGPGQIHTDRATITSATRRKLVEEGEYKPICYTLIWPRKHIIKWATSEQ